MKKILYVVKENYLDTRRFFPGAGAGDPGVQTSFILIQGGKIPSSQENYQLYELDSDQKNSVSREDPHLPSISYSGFLQKIFEVDLAFVV